VTKYKVILPSRPRQHIVEFDSSTSLVMCNCKIKIKNIVGILRVHSLKVLTLQNFKGYQINIF
jgi:hypothetical protein